MNNLGTLSVFTDEEKRIADDLLSAKVATMLGRKMEEDDWNFVYCNSKKIPVSNWSNLNIDINYDGLGVEHKMLRITKTGTILNECGTVKMHPTGTRSIRIPQETDPEKAKVNILKQYGDLIEERTQKVRESSGIECVDMRIGWLLWKSSLEEFLYFEEPMSVPDPSDFYAEWNVTNARGSRKQSRSLWVYEKSSKLKKYSITTDAGAKVQPYFKVPIPSDPNLYYFKVQGVSIDGGLVKVWLTRSTARYLELLIGSLEVVDISNAIDRFQPSDSNQSMSQTATASDIAIAIYVTDKAYTKLKNIYEPISDEYVFQQFAIELGAGS